MTASIVGRDPELASLRAFVAAVSDGAAALVFEGPAGVGKTTLWTQGVELAQEDGVRVLRTRPAESETSFSFSGLGDLLEPFVDEALASLPGPQRRALSYALALEDAEDRPLDGRTVAVAALNAIRSLVTTSSLVVAVDDAQWLDSASEAVLTYAARRLSVEPVGMLLARRAPLESTLVDELRRSLPADRFTEIGVGPLEPGELHRAIQGQLGVMLPRPLLTEVHRESGGNPFYALEIVRMLQRSGFSADRGEHLPLPDSLRDLVQGRLLALPAESREYLLAAAAVAQPTLQLVEAASGVNREAGVGPALEARVVELDGDRLRFTHPLLAAAAYDAAEPLRRRSVHARLAELVEDPEARALHLSASVTEPEEEVANVLERAAAGARGRGAPRAAAKLLERASELTPGERREDEVRRAVEAAYLHYESGDSRRADARLTEVIAQLHFGRARARALMRLARVRAYVALAEAADLFLRAVEEAEGDREILAVAHEGVATCLFRRHERLPESVEHAGIAAGLAEELGDSALAAEAWGTRWVAEVLLGRDTTSSAERALVLQEAIADRRVLAQPRFTVAAIELWLTSGLEHARDDFVDMLRRARELGDESSAPLVLAHLAEAEYELGNIDAARARALEGQEAAEQSGQRTVFAYNLAVESLAEAVLGRRDRARSLARRVLELVPQVAGRDAEFAATRALGQLELVLGTPDAAATTLIPLVAFVRDEQIAEPGVAPFAADLVEALLELGRREEATDVLDWYEGNAERLGRASALAAAGRCRGLLAAADGNLEEALASYARALEWHAQVLLPLDRARTLLALGIAQRRAKQRREARQTLEEAVAAFERIGAALWAERARAELRRISGRAPSAGELTPAEARVAQLVAEGKSNREVAATLSLSERTVEGHLSRVYGKLGVRSRTQLARAIGARKP